MFEAPAYAYATPELCWCPEIPCRCQPMVKNGMLKTHRGFDAEYLIHPGVRVAHGTGRITAAFTDPAGQAGRCAGATARRRACCSQETAGMDQGIVRGDYEAA